MLVWFSSLLSTQAMRLTNSSSIEIDVFSLNVFMSIGSVNVWETNANETGREWPLIAATTFPIAMWLTMEERNKRRQAALSVTPSDVALEPPALQLAAGHFECDIDARLTASLGPPRSRITTPASKATT